MSKTFEQAQAAYDAMLPEDLEPDPRLDPSYEEEQLLLEVDEDDEYYDWDGANGWQLDIND